MANTRPTSFWAQDICLPPERGLVPPASVYRFSLYSGFKPELPKNVAANFATPTFPMLLFLRSGFLQVRAGLKEHIPLYPSRNSSPLQHSRKLSGASELELLASRTWQAYRCRPRDRFLLAFLAQAALLAS